MQKPAVNMTKLPGHACVNLRESLEYLGHKHNFNPRNFNLPYNSVVPSHFELWCKKHKLNAKAKSLAKQQELARLYAEAFDGLATVANQAPVDDVYQWLLDFRSVLKKVSPAHKSASFISFNTTALLQRFDLDFAGAFRKQQEAQIEASFKVLTATLPSWVSTRVRKPVLSSDGRLPDFMRKVLALYAREFNQSLCLTMPT